MRFFNQFPADIAITACADHDSRDSPLPASDRGSSFALKHVNSTRFNAGF